MKYPTIEQVKEADHLQICRWHRFLLSPENEEQILIINKVYNKFIAGGQMTPEISKEIGWSKKLS